ncbi:MAG TPA: ABC transporter permease [Anaerolineae bacterium]|nr:ABC transporter permease [Anaerolineae bacterium]
MRLTDVSLSNLRRRKGRMALLVAGLMIGVATVVALTAITTTMRADIASKMDQYGANILIVPEANDLTLSYGGVTVASAAFDVSELTMPDLEQIGTIKDAASVAIVAPKLLGTATVGGQSVLVAGVRFSDEIRLKQWWHVSQGMEPAAMGDALLGSRLATTLGLGPGDRVQVEGQAFQVVGVLAENGSQDDDILFIDLAAAQQAMGKPGLVSLAEVAALCDACPVEEMVDQISGVLPQARVTALRQAVQLRMDTVGQLEQFALAVSAVVVVIGALVVLTTMLGAVSERRQEIGLFRALGFRQSHVMRIVLSEAALVSVAGGLLGWLMGMGAAVVLAPRLAGVTEPVAWSPWLALAALGGALLVGLLASLYPARSAARLDPSMALRSL